MRAQGMCVAVSIWMTMCGREGIKLTKLESRLEPHPEVTEVFNMLMREGLIKEHLANQHVKVGNTGEGEAAWDQDVSTSWCFRADQPAVLHVRNVCDSVLGVNHDPARFELKVVNGMQGAYQEYGRLKSARVELFEAHGLEYRLETGVVPLLSDSYEMEVPDTAEAVAAWLEFRGKAKSYTYEVLARFTVESVYPGTRPGGVACLADVMFRCEDAVKAGYGGLVREPAR